MSLLLQVVLAMLLLMKPLGLDLLASALARTQVEAVSLALVVTLPPVLLPGFVIPRGAILRGAGLVDRLPSGAGLVTCWVVLMSISVGRFRKQVE